MQRTKREHEDGRTTTNVGRYQARNINPLVDHYDVYPGMTHGQRRMLWSLLRAYLADLYKGNPYAATKSNVDLLNRLAGGQ